MTDQTTPDAPQFDVHQRTEIPTLAVRLQPAWATLDMGALLGEYMPALGAALGANGTTPAGAPFVRYHSFNEDCVDVEIGVPIAVAPAALAALDDLPAGEVGASSLPGGLIAMTVHSGPYDALEGTYDRFHDAIHASGHDDGDGPWETYLNSPEDVASPADLRTEIHWPLRS